MRFQPTVGRALVCACECVCVIVCVCACVCLRPIRRVKKGHMRLSLEQIVTKSFLMEMGSTLSDLSNQEKLT